MAKKKEPKVVFTKEDMKDFIESIKVENSGIALNESKMPSYYLRDIISDTLKKLSDSEFSKVYSMTEEDLRFWPSQASVEYYPKLPDGSSQHSIKVVGGKCLRSSYWQMKGEPKTNRTNGNNILKMQVGKDLEIRILDDIKVHENKLWANNYKFHSYVNMKNLKLQKSMGKNTIHISGELDAIFVDPKSKKFVGCELKTSYGYWFTKEQVLNKTPKIANLLQTMLYLYHFQARLRETEPEVPCEYFQIDYFDRGDFHDAEIYTYLQEVDGKYYPVINNVLWDNITYNAIIDRYMKLREYFLNDELPPRDFTIKYDLKRLKEMKALGKLTKKKEAEFLEGKSIGDFECSYCPYRSKCWG